MNIKEMVKDFRLRAMEAEKASDRMALKESYAESKRILREAITKHNIDCKGFSFRKLFMECFGSHELTHAIHMNEVDFTSLRESAGAVSTAAFQNIAGQFAYGMVLEKYQAPEFVVTKSIPVRQGNVPGLEKIPGITEIGDESGEVGEGQNYPLAGVGENWIYFSEPKKKGMIVPLTKEAIFYDKTGQLVKMASDVGYNFGKMIEKAAVDCVIDENVTTHRHNWKGTISATYNASSPWANLVTSNALVDWTDIEAANEKLRTGTDPFTGEPILFPPTHLYAPSALEWTAAHILAASTVMRTTPGFATSANPNQNEAPNPVLRLGLTLVSTPYINFRQATDTSWYLANSSRAWVRNEHWPMDVQQSAANSQDEFDADIVMKFKVNGKMKYETVEPRAAVKSTVA